MNSWIKSNIHQRMNNAAEKYRVADKCNDTFTMTGMKFIIKELESLSTEIREYEEREWKYKTLELQIKKDFASYNLSQAQVDELVIFLLQQNMSVENCYHLIQIVLQDGRPEVIYNNEFKK